MAARRKALTLDPTDGVPVKPDDIKFCELWVKYSDHITAGKEMGWGKVRAWKVRNRFALYLGRMQATKEREIVKDATVGQREILAELLALGMANPQDYIEQYTDVVDGKSVTRYRQKDLMSLTRHQAAAISRVNFKKDGTLTYTLPNRNEKVPGLVNAGRHFGMFHDKLIAEHRHQHLHGTMPSFKGADPALLKRMEDDLISVVGPDEARKLLGAPLEGEFEDVSEG